MKYLAGKVLTVTGPKEPSAIGRVMMHEHLHADMYDGATDRMVWEERPTSPARRELLLREAVPLLADCRRIHGMGSVTRPCPRGALGPTSTRRSRAHRG